ncbi:hypothetical protein [Nostoc sp.]|uniref:hypothetical protein n=1 Tax=Nostoc sp. TaxID=1180 RepID=UPI002FF5A5B0
MSVIRSIEAIGAGNSKLSYTLQVNLHLVFMTLLTAFRQLYVMDITLTPLSGVSTSLKNLFGG